MSRITTKQFVKLIQGKNLTTEQIAKLIKRTYPKSDMTRSQVCTRLRAMVKSPNVDIEKTGQGNQARYRLNCVADRFIELGDANYRQGSNETRTEKAVKHSHPIEKRFCQLHKMFDEALAKAKKGARS
ncbi:hypothetical protein [Serratia aquatilis]|uniref:Phage protein n=1 Tax=Serratia aquatilis TaxID=1737515 RepID=A0ABV6E9F9_9GAMM